MKPGKTGTFIFILMVFGLISQPLSAQNQSVSDRITKALQAGNASMLSTHLNASVDLSIPGNEGAYSKKQAGQILKMFFTKNPVKTFTLEHTGNSTNGSTYLIGSYESNAGKIFRVYLLIKERNGIELIQQIQFEEE